MSIDQRFNNHPAIQLAESIKTRLNAEDASQININDRDFIFSVIEYFMMRVNTVPAGFEPIVTQTLNNAQQPFQQILHELNSFFANKNYAHINAAKSHLSSIISYANYLPYFVPGENNLASIISDFKNSVLKDLDQIQNKFKDVNNQLKDKFNDFNNQINDKFKNVDNQINVFHQKVSEINTRFNEQQQQINQLSSNFTGNFNQLISRINKEFEEEKKKTTEQANELVNKISSKLEEAGRIVTIISNSGIAGNYHKNAESHKEQANTWRIVAITFMVAGIIYMAITVWNIDDYEWHTSLLRILAGFLIIYPAQYSAWQSKIHRDQEIYNKKMELDLASIDPFIAPFDEKKKQEIKEKLVDRYFNPTTPSQKSETEISITVYEKILNPIINLIKSIKG